MGDACEPVQRLGTDAGYIFLDLSCPEYGSQDVSPPPFAAFVAALFN